MSPTRRIAFLSQHLSGTGHLVRTQVLAAAAADAGHDVMLISGGRPLPHLENRAHPSVEHFQLPALTVHDLDFSQLCDAGGFPASDAYLAERQSALTEAIEIARPHALVTELFPLGRRMLAPEFETAIATARQVNPHVAILSSVRDIPEPKPKRLAAAARRLHADYDALLVHGDPALVPLSATWPLPADLSPKIHHTGYVSPDVAALPAAPSDAASVLVSVGGGDLGRALLGLAAEAARKSSHTWHLLVGGADAEEHCTQLRKSHGSRNMRVEPARTDYRARLGAATVSVSLAGYNTAVDLAGCDTQAILIPSEQGGEQEQLIRARALARFEGIRLMRLQDVTPAALAEAVDESAAAGRRPPLPINTSGAVRALERMEAAIARRLTEPDR